MYGPEKSHLPWSTPPPKRRTVQTGGNDEYDTNLTKRHSTGMNCFGLDGSESSAASGGFTQVSRGVGHSRSGSVGYHMSNAGEGSSGGGVGEKSQREKVNQLVQAYFWKASMVIIQSRVPVVSLLSQRTQDKKTNKWFNIELDEMESFREELRPWRLGDSFDPRPQPLIIETYLDTSDLTATQALVILDSEEKRWNVTETLENAANRAGLNVGLRRGERGTAKAQQIVLERWRVELSPPFDLVQNPELPVVYKKGIILFRALYSYVSLMPTWKFRRRLAKLKLHSGALRIGCRVQSGDEFVKSAQRLDGLEIPLFPGDERVTDDFAFGKVESPAGAFNISVSYRKNCDFRVDDSEALLSSHFINLDEHYFRPSLLHQRTPSQPSTYATARGIEHGSLPSAVSTAPHRPEYNAAYGSLSSFHQPTGLASASPISALRATEMARSSSNSSLAERPLSGLRSIQGSRSSLKGTDVPQVSRRSSISFQPFKSPSLSASPAASDQVLPGSSLGRVNTPAAQIRHRVSVGAASPSSYKSAHSTVTPSGENLTTQTPIPIFDPSKPQPMTRIASSFGTRRPRISSGASITRNADDDNSSGQASYTSSTAAPGSALYTTAAGTSSYDEDLQIRDFMSMLADGQRATLKSFGGSGEAANRSTGNPLSKFQRMKDSQSALADSMSSSLLLQPSSSPSTSSRNLSSVPGMIPSTTFSSSSSPGKPLSPHTPHTPAIPSRLSEGLTAQYHGQHPEDQRHHHPRSPPVSGDNRIRNYRERIAEGTATTSPLDIPLSPRFMGPRRANSMSQQGRDTIEGHNSVEFDPMVPFDNHRQSISLGSVDRAPLSMSRLIDLRNASQSALPGREAAEAESRQGNDVEDDVLAFGPARPLSMETTEDDAPRYANRFHRGSGVASSGSSYRGRFSARGRGDTPPMGSTSSLEKGQPNSNARPSIIGRRTPSWSRPGPEDEDLLFAMSDMMGVQQSRRSLDHDNRAGSNDLSSSSGRRRSRGDSGRGVGGGWLAG